MRSFWRVLDHAQPASAQTYKDFRRFGFDGVMRYIASPDAIYDWKRVSVTEVVNIHAADLGLLLVFQNGGNGVGYFTNARGLLDGQHAKAAAAAIGFPRSLPIFFAVDFNAQPADYDELLAYFNGVYNGMLHADGRPTHPVGVYAHYDLLLHVQRNWQGIEHYWETYAWSGGLVLPAIDGFQYSNGATVAGHNVDLNEFRIEPWHLAP